MRVVGQQPTERLDERRLADTRRPADTDAYRAAGVRRQRIEQRLGPIAIIGATRLGKRNGLRQGTAAAAEHPLDQRIRRSVRARAHRARPALGSRAHSNSTIG